MNGKIIKREGLLDELWDRETKKEKMFIVKCIVDGAKNCHTKCPDLKIVAGERYGDLVRVSEQEGRKDKEITYVCTKTIPPHEIGYTRIWVKE